MRWLVGALLGLLVGGLVGFGLAYLIWTLDGQPRYADVWAAVAAFVWTVWIFAGALVGGIVGERLD